MRTSNLRGPQPIFRDKRNGYRVQGMLTAKGGEYFEEAREALSKLAGKQKSKTSDADVIEYLARGVENTLDYIHGLRE
jgi:hypothetical protein